MKHLLLFISIVAVSTTVHAQQGLSKISIQQSTHMPVGSLKGFIEKPSLRGGSVSYQYFATNQLSLGFMAGYSDLYQKKNRQTYMVGETEVSAVKSHSLQTTPFLLTAGYNKLKEGSVIQPYANIGVGAAFISYEEWYGTLVDDAGGLKFSLAPEIGTRIAFNKYSLSGIDLSVRYHFTAFKYNDVKNLQTLSLNLGLFFFTRN